MGQPAIQANRLRTTRRQGRIRSTGEYAIAICESGPRWRVNTVAGAGTNQGTAAALSPGINLVTGADATVGVILPTAKPGMEVVIKNIDAANAVLKVYPASGGTINALSPDGAISLAAKVSAHFIATSATQWYTIPLLPS